MDQVVAQLTVAMIAGIEATRRGLLAFVQEMGLAALQELLAVQAAELAGPKGKHNADGDATIGAPPRPCFRSEGETWWCLGPG